MSASMDENESAASGKSETALLDVLRLLMDTGKVRTTADLLKYARQYGAPDAEERLSVLTAEDIPLDLAYDSVSVHLRLLAHKRNSTLVASCREKKAALVLPLPPHVPELFMSVAEVTFLQPAAGTLIGSLTAYGESAVKGTRECRTKIQEMAVAVFEAYREGDTLYLDATIADVLEPKLLPAGIRLIAHLRPHRNPEDVLFAPPSEVQFI